MSDKQVVTLYTVEEPGFGEDLTTTLPEIHFLPVRRVPIGFRAINRAGLAFRCRVLIHPDQYEESAEAAVQRYVREKTEALEKATREYVYARRVGAAFADGRLTIVESK